MNRKKVGLLVMAYGTPYQESDIVPYYTHIRHGKTPTEGMINNLIERYQAIGGISPLAKITYEQGKKMEESLNLMQDKLEFKLYLGLKHIAPFIEDAVKEMKEDQIEQAVSIVLAPHYSSFSTEVYNRRAQKAAEELGGIQIHSINEWYQEDGFIQYWSEEISNILTKRSEKELERTVVICSAHSLPEKILEYGDPYPEQLKDTARLIANKLQFNHVVVGWQSEGQTGEPWLGPDVQDLTKDLYNQGYRSFIYAPVGFVSDHLEVLYDNDYECKLVTNELNASYDRPPMPNTDPRFIKTLTRVIVREANAITNEGVNDLEKTVNLSSMSVRN